MQVGENAIQLHTSKNAIDQCNINYEEVNAESSLIFTVSPSQSSVCRSLIIIVRLLYIAFDTHNVRLMKMWLIA